MNQQIDKFFRDKLENYQTPAPDGAWNKLEKKINKKNQPGLWLKIAASFLLIAVSIFLLWPTNKSIPNNNTAVQKTEHSSRHANAEKIAVIDVPDEVKEQEITRTPLKSSGIKKGNKKIDVVMTEMPDTAVTAKEIVRSETTATQNEVISEPATHRNNAVTIIYKVEEVNEKYLDEKILVDATPDEKRTSTFKKLLGKAKALKKNQDPFGELRQKKNEILALNFSKENRKQN
jgi:hypothetical protein